MELITFVIAFLIGAVMGLTGAGGSILAVPVFTYLLRLDIITATGYSLFVVGITSLVGAIKNVVQKNIELKPALYFSIPSLTTVIVTRGTIVPLIPDEIFSSDSLVIGKQTLLLGLFAFLIFYAAYSMLKKKKVQEIKPVFDIKRLALQGAVLGVIMGLLGAGGGFMVVPVLVLIAGMEMKKAIGTSLMIISVNALSGFIAGASGLENIDWIFLVKFTVLMVAGILTGGYLTSKIDSQKLKTGFAWFITGVGAYILVKEFLSL
jgi:uncharacterized membrane protein YfcA